MKNTITYVGIDAHKKDPRHFASLSTFRVRKTNSYEVSDHFKRIKQGQTATLPELVLIFDSYEVAKSFHCTYDIVVSNLPERITGELHFVVTDRNSERCKVDGPPVARSPGTA